MIIDWIFLSLVLSSLVILFWVHFGKDPEGKPFTYRFRICTCWICLAVQGVANILEYAFSSSHLILNLVIGLIAFTEVIVEACYVVCRIDKELEDSEC